MKKILYTLLSLCAVTIIGCSKDSDSGSITAANEGLYVENFGESASTTFTLDNVSNVTIYLVPDGWNASVTMSTKTVTVTAPSSADNGEELIGYIVLYGKTPNETAVYETIDVGKVDFIELDDDQANSMIVARPGTFCTFNPNRRGESTDEVLIKASDCMVEWSTTNYPIKHIQMVGDRIGFFVNIDEDDVDEDGDTTDLIDGNAVISALSASDVKLWSWHIWITEREISEVNINGVTFMDRNLGAFMNSNLDDTSNSDTDYTDSISKSYGLYYQWGRKDPFIYPYYYNMAGNYDALSYDDDGSFLYFEYDDSSSATGTIAYSTLYPHEFIAGNSDSKYDWLYSSGNNSLWDDNGSKSIYDPSPKGWRVPSTSDLAAIGDPASGEVTIESYGAYLGDELFMALGRRIYLDGALQNLAPGDLYQPWSGYYWSRDAAADSDSGARMSTALHFYRDDSSAEVTLNRAASLYRSTGAQIRCVKM